MSYREYTVRIIYDDYEKNPEEYIEKLKQAFLRPTLQGKEMLYQIEFNQFITWNVIGSFTERSIHKLNEKLMEYKQSPLTEVDGL